MDSLAITYKTGSTYLLPSTIPSTPGLTPNASSTSSYSLSTSPSMSVCPSIQPSSPHKETLDRRDPVIHRASSRPSLRHMPSWRSFASHMSRKSRGSVDADSESSADEGYDAFGAYEDAIEPKSPLPKSPIRDIKDRGRDKGNVLTIERRSTRKGGGSSGFARALKKLSLGSLGRHAEYMRESRTDGDEADTEGGQRTDTPMELPPPKPISRPSMLSPIPLSPTASDFEDFFTPPTIPTSILHSLPALPAHPTFPRSFARTKLWTEGITPTPVHTPIKEQPQPPDTADTFEDSAQDTSDNFDVDIFSPRVRQAPVLRGIIDSLPVSPLELPDSKVHLGKLFDTTSFPTPVLPRNAAPSPIVSASAEATMPSLGQVASDLHAPSPVRPQSGFASTFRLPRASVPTSSNSSASLFPHSTISPSLPYARRHSAIIRPPILPSPTPPSLIASPRSLGTPLIPPGPTSPQRLDTLAGKPAPGVTSFESLPDIRPSSRIRKSSTIGRVRAVSPTSGLGFGTMTQAGSGFRKKEQALTRVRAGSEERLSTPGTFGLQGEAEKRLVTEGVNPYFA